MKAIEDDLVGGRLELGTRLLPHRELAYRLGLSVGTVSRAYATAEKRGLIIGEVGRGTFVRPPANGEDRFFGDGRGEVGPIDLSLNLPPSSTQTKAVSAMLSTLSASGCIEPLLTYLPHRGLAAHREAVAAWIQRGGFGPSAEQVVICHGAQHAMALVLGLIAKAGDTVLTEELTYAGIKALANWQQLRLHGVGMDGDGIVPDALDEACERTGGRILYAMPTLQNPTALISSIRRREALAEIVHRRRITVLEDDVYGFLSPDAPPPLATLAADQTFYVGSFSKCIAPGLRIGFVAAPERYVDRLVAGVRATAWMATPMMAEMTTRWIQDGTAAALAEDKRLEALARREIAAHALGARLAPAPPASFHVWLRLPNIRPDEFASRARARGVAITPPEAVSVGVENAQGVRLCLGAAETRAQLARALTILTKMIEDPREEAFSVV